MVELAACSAVLEATAVSVLRVDPLVGCVLATFTRMGLKPVGG
jgi:hypothetical protein